MIDRFQSKRLAARRLVESDYEQLHAMHRDERIMKTLGGVRSEEETREFVRQSLEHWDRHGYGLWILSDRETGAFAGRAGLRSMPVDGRPEVELHCALVPEFWGKDYATEIGRALVRLGLERLGLESIVAFTLITNLASQRAQEKIGFLYEKEFIHKDLPHVLRRMTRSRYEDLRSEWEAAICAEPGDATAD